MLYACKEHVEIALDDMIDETGNFPKLTEIDDQLSTKACAYCEKQAHYLVANKDSDPSCG